jgi:hypothetical protein
MLRYLDHLADEQGTGKNRYRLTSPNTTESCQSRAPSCNALNGLDGRK